MARILTDYEWSLRKNDRIHKQNVDSTSTNTRENRQAGVPKNMIPDLEWFNRDKTKFED